MMQLKQTETGCFQTPVFQDRALSHGPSDCGPHRSACQSRRPCPCRRWFQSKRLQHQQQRLQPCLDCRRRLIVGFPGRPDSLTADVGNTDRNNRARATAGGRSRFFFTIKPNCLPAVVCDGGVRWRCATAVRDDGVR